MSFTANRIINEVATTKPGTAIPTVESTRITLSCHFSLRSAERQPSGIPITVATTTAMAPILAEMGNACLIISIIGLFLACT